MDGTYARLHVPGGSGQDVPAPSYTSVMKNVSEPTGAIQNISGTNYTITSDGVYSIQAGFTGTITVNAQNVKITQANSSTALNEVQIVVLREATQIFGSKDLIFQTAQIT